MPARLPYDVMPWDSLDFANSLHFSVFTAAAVCRLYIVRISFDDAGYRSTERWIPLSCGIQSKNVMPRDDAADFVPSRGALFRT